MGWTFSECLKATRVGLDENCDWNRAEISMRYLGSCAGWIGELNQVDLTGHIEPFECTLSVGTYEDLVKE